MVFLGTRGSFVMGDGRFHGEWMVAQNGCYDTLVIPPSWLHTPPDQLSMETFRNGSSAYGNVFQNHMQPARTSVEFILRRIRQLAQTTILRELFEILPPPAPSVINPPVIDTQNIANAAIDDTTPRNGDIDFVSYGALPSPNPLGGHSDEPTNTSDPNNGAPLSQENGVMGCNTPSGTSADVTIDPQNNANDTRLLAHPIAVSLVVSSPCVDSQSETTDFQTVVPTGEDFHTAILSRANALQALASEPPAKPISTGGNDDEILFETSAVDDVDITDQTPVGEIIPHR